MFWGVPGLEGVNIKGGVKKGGMGDIKRRTWSPEGSPETFCEGLLEEASSTSLLYNNTKLKQTRGGLNN